MSDATPPTAAPHTHNGNCMHCAMCERDRVNSDALFDVWDSASPEPPAWTADLPPAQITEISIAVSVFPETSVTLSMPDREALLKMRLDARLVHVFLIVRLPREFDPERSSALPSVVPSIRIRSPNAATRVVVELQEELDREIREWCSMGSFSLITALGRATELVVDLPLGLQSPHFGSCTDCNRSAARKGLKKAPQPVTVEVLPASKLPPQVREDEIYYAEDDDITMDMRSLVKCITCGSTNDVILVPSLQLNCGDKEQLCSFCYFDDNPLIDMQCGCRSCFTCFITFAGISATIREVRKSPRSSWYGIGCPTHTGNVIEDPSIYKLLDTAVYLRMTQFAMQHCLHALGAISCRNPECGAPVLCDITGDKWQCSRCNAWSCETCRVTILQCTCATWPAPVPRIVPVVTGAALMSERAIKSRDAIEGPPQPLKLMLVFGRNRPVIDVLSTSLKWRNKALRKLFPEVPLCTAVDIFLLFVFQGVPLRTDRPLASFGVHTGAVIHVVQMTQITKNKIDKERELFDFRREIAAAANNQKPAKVAGGGMALFKGCPKCHMPVIHYRDHGCHHIGFGKGLCCGHHWCYVCRGPHPCPTCPLMCNDHCGCLPCPDCQPGYPCPYCWGCKMCKLTNEAEMGIFD